MKYAKRISAAALMLALLCAVALADGGWVGSRLHGSVQLAAAAGDYGYEWIDATGFGAGNDTACVVSRNASVWSQPRTNSNKLGSAKNGEKLSVHTDGGAPVMQSGFYSVSYKGREGWINSAYVVCGTPEITLMESNVPAYCAPSRNAKRVGSLSKLTSYTVLGFYGPYYVVSLREAAAFIPMSCRHYDSQFASLYRNASTYRGTTSRKTQLRTGPGEEYATVRDIGSGQRFTCYDEIDGWYLTIDSDTGCFVYIDSDDADVAF